jgi:hypothetical protein
VVRAALEGRAEVRLGVSARAATLAHGVAPGWTARLLGRAARLLPQATGQPPGPRGRDLRSPLPGSALLRLTDAAARRNNESPPVAGRS